MSTRNAKNISYFDFFNSKDKEYENIRSILLQIPEFQRDYVWGKEEVRDLVQSIVEADTGYYLGNLVTVKSDGVADKVVDGQQRLVTLSLIVKSIEPKISKANKEKARKILFNEKEARIFLHKEELNDVYQKIIRGDELLEQEEGSSIFAVFQVIPRILEKEILGDDFNLLFEKIISLEFVVLKCSSEEAAYQLFEGLNSTGLSLSAMELTKNAILGKMKSIGSLEDLNNAVITWSNMEAVLQKNTKGLPNKFLRHQWYSIGGYVTNSKLFGEIKDKKIRGTTKERLQDYLREIQEDSEKYISLRDATVSKRNFSEKIDSVAWRKAQLLLGHLSSLNLDQVYSVLLSLNKYGVKIEEYFKRDSFPLHVERLWAFAFIMKYSSVSPSSYERVFANLCRDIHDCEKTKSYSDFKDHTEKFFKNLREIADVKEDFSKTISSSFSKKTDRDMLRTLCLQYLSAGKDLLGEFKLEHIIPQGDLAKWTKIDEQFIKEIEYEKYQIGNLTLLKEDLVGNEDFDFKYKEAYSQSIFQDNKKLKDEYGELFNSANPAEAVRNRSKMMAEKIFDIYIKTIYEK